MESTPRAVWAAIVQPVRSCGDSVVAIPGLPVQVPAMRAPRVARVDVSEVPGAIARVFDPARPNREVRPRVLRKDPHRTSRPG